MLSIDPFIDFLFTSQRLLEVFHQPIHLAVTFLRSFSLKEGKAFSARARSRQERLAGAGGST